MYPELYTLSQKVIVKPSLQVDGSVTQSALKPPSNVITYFLESKSVLRKEKETVNKSLVVCPCCK